MTACGKSNLARMLAGTHTLGLDRDAGRRCGELLGRAHTSDVVDGHIALITNDGDTVLTSDVPDIRRLLRARGVHATVSRV